MGQVNRYIKDNPALDDVDHALGRPLNPFDTYRNHYATDCPDKIAEFEASEWWDVGQNHAGMTFCQVSDVGRKALAQELSKAETYGRRYELTCDRWDGPAYIMAKSPSAAKYAAYIEADLDWPFMEFCEGLRVRIAT
ncbi:MAG: hypothetical protein AAGK79_13300 [Pseudomonadota bacterium]